MSDAEWTDIAANESHWNDLFSEVEKYPRKVEMRSVSELVRAENEYWYLCTPYTKWPQGLDDAAWVACKLRGNLMLAGVNVFSPIVHSHYVARACNIDPIDHKLWLADDLPFFGHAYGLLVANLFGWQESYGIAQELKWAREHYRPRLLIDPETLDWEPLP